MITIKINGRNYAIVSLDDVVTAQDDIITAHNQNDSMKDVIGTSIFASYTVDDNGIFHYAIKNNVVVLDDDYLSFRKFGPIERLHFIDGKFAWLTDFIHDLGATPNMTERANELKRHIIKLYMHVKATELLICSAAISFDNNPSRPLPPEDEGEYEEDDELPF